MINQTSTFTLPFPNDVWLKIFKELPLGDHSRSNFTKTCKNLYGVGNDNSCWNDLLEPNYRTAKQRLQHQKPENAQECFLNHPESRISLYLP